MKNIFQILFSKRLWINAVLIGVLILAIVYGTLIWLGQFTRHGEAVKVPHLVGLSIDVLEDALETVNLSYEVTDSIYSDEFTRGTVIQQNPTPGRELKEGRIIYLTVNSLLPEMVVMPDLSGKSRRIAVPILEISGLEVEALTYRPDESCTDCVIDQLYKGKTIAPGAQIRKGEGITLVLGQQSNELTEVPRLLGLTYEEGYGLLNAYSLNMGGVLSCDGCETADDTARAFVINQRPEPHGEATLGAFVDVYLSMDSTKAAHFLITNDTLRYEDPFTDDPFE